MVNFDGFIEIKYSNNIVENFIKWLLEGEEINYNEFKNFIKDDELVKEVIRELKDKSVIIETDSGFIVSETAKIFKHKKIEELKPILFKLLEKKEGFGFGVKTIIKWENIDQYLKKFVIYKGEPIIYEMTFEIDGKEGVILLEGKDIVDYKNFILKFFEEFGTMLPTYHGIGKDWANLLTKWCTFNAEINYEKSETLNPLIEAKELLINYIENSVISDNYSLKEGIVCYKNDTLFVSTQTIKKLLKRNDLNVSLRNLSYLLKDYLLSGSIPIKIENKSERFWRFNPKKFNLNFENKLDSEEKEEDNV